MATVKSKSKRDKCCDLALAWIDDAGFEDLHNYVFNHLTDEYLNMTAAEINKLWAELEARKADLADWVDELDGDEYHE